MITATQKFNKLLLFSKELQSCNTFFTACPMTAMETCQYHSTVFAEKNS